MLPRIRSLFSSRQVSSTAPRSKRSRGFLARKSVKLILEILEDRLAPTVNLLYSPGALTVLADNSTSAPAQFTVSATSGAVTIKMTSGGDPNGMSFGSSGTPPGFILANVPYGSSGSASALSTPAVITNLSFAGPGGEDDTVDTVTLSAFSLKSSPTAELVVSAGTINFTAGDTVSGVSELIADAGTTGTVNFGAGSVVSARSYLTARAGTINFQGSGSTAAKVNATNVSLTSVNSLAVASTGVPYLGSVTLNVGPPSGQPFAGQPYLTGPDWGTYGYAPGDTIAITGAGALTSGTISAIIGHNLYLNSSSNSTAISADAPNTSKTFTNATVQCSGFTPEISATYLNLVVTGAGSTISGALSGTASNLGSDNYLFLNAATAGGNITLEDLPPASTYLVLGGLNAGTGSIDLALNGSIESTAWLYYVYNLAHISPGITGTTLLTAGAVDLTTTGPGSDIGFAGGSLSTYFPIATRSGAPGQGLELTAATNDGSVYIQDSSPAGLVIDSVVADQKGQAPTVSDDQILFNNTPSSSTPTYTSGFNNVSVTSQGPIVLNSVSATGQVGITGERILEGNAQSPNVIAPSVDLAATGTADYQGQVTFAQGSAGDTLTLPATGPNWSTLGFAAGDAIVVYGAVAGADDSAFTIASVSGFTLTLTASYVLIPETQAGITVGDGMIGQPSAAIALADVPLFDASTQNGDIYLALGGSVNSTAVNVSAGGMHGMSNGVSVTSEADFLTIENITATGDAAVAMSGGSVIEYGSPGLITGQIVSLTSPYNIGTASSPLQTDATSGLTVAATATSPSFCVHLRKQHCHFRSRGDRGQYLRWQRDDREPGNVLSFQNGVLSETGAAVVTFANTDNNDGSAGDVVVGGTVHASSIVAGISADGTAGAGQILTNSSLSGVIDGDGGTVILERGQRHRHFGNFPQHRKCRDPGCDDGYRRHRCHQWERQQ